MKIKHLPPEVSDASEVCRYKMWAGATSGTSLHDYSGNGNTGTLVSDPSFAYPGVDLDGVADYISSSAFQSTFRASFTIALWVKPRDGRPATNEYLCGVQSADGGDEVQVAQTTSGGFICIYEAGGNSARADTAGGQFSDGQEDWHYICMVGDSTVSGVGGIVIYIDGAVVALSGNVGDTTGVTFTDFTNVASFGVGCWLRNGTPFANSFVDGLMDEFVIYEEAKSAAQIKDLYEQTRWRYGV